MYSCNRSALRRGGKEYRLKDRQITTVAKTLLITLNVGLFAWVWTDFYNNFAFRTHRPEGAVGSIIVYFILYLWLTKLYRGYAIASSSVEETALSQFISFGIADLTLYIAANLLRRNYVDVWPGAGIVVLQLVGSTLIVYLTRRYMLTHIRPASTLLVYGASTRPSEAEQFTARLCRKYRHLFAVNTLLPDDIRVRHSQEVSTSFHARFSAIGKEYRYWYYAHPHASALYRNLSWHVIYPLDLEKMRREAMTMLGTHDFAPFAASGSVVKDTRRTVDAISLSEAGPFIELRVHGNGFLYNMVRILAGTLAQVGSGKRAPGAIERALETGSRLELGATAPPQGLMLLRVDYPEELCLPPT